MKKWFRRIFKKDNPNRAGDAPGAMAMPEISASQAGAMVEMIEKTAEVELTCDEVHRLLGQYAEMALRGEDTAQLLPLVHQHLEMCADCREEFEALMRILQTSSD